MPVHAMKAHRWSRGIAPLILKLGTSCSLSTSHIGCSGPVKEHRCQLHRRLDGPQSRSGSFGDERNAVVQSGIQPRTVQLVA